MSVNKNSEDDEQFRYDPILEIKLAEAKSSPKKRPKVLNESFELLHYERKKKKHEKTSSHNTDKTNEAEVIIAEKKYKRNELICELESEIISDAEALKRFQRNGGSAMENLHLLNREKSLWIDTSASKKKSGPITQGYNAKKTTVKVDDTFKVFLAATIDINQGETLSFS